MHRFRDELPFANALSSDIATFYCAKCFKKSDCLKVCGKCHFCFYCDPVCQKSDWKVHKNECPCLVNAGGQIPDKQVRLVARIIFKLNRGDTGDCEIDGQKRSFTDLMSHHEDISQAVQDIQNPTSFRDQALITASITSLITAKNAGETITNQALSDQLKKTFNSENISKIMRGLDYINFGQNLRKFLGEKYLNGMSEYDIMDIYGKVCINSFAIDNLKNEPIGTGLYICFSTLDHSCDPDLSFNFDGVKAFLLNLKPWDTIKSKTLKQLRISYLEPGLIRRDRLQKLNDRYYFACDCNYCADNLREKRMTASLCSKQGCDGPALLDTINGSATCELCEASSNEVAEAIKLMEQKSAILESMDNLCQEKDYQTAYKKTQELIPQIRTNLHAINRTRAELLMKFSGVAKSLLKFKEAADLCEDAMYSERKFVPELSPSWISTNLEQARTYLAAGDKVKAAQLSKQAMVQCEQVHGKRNSLYSEIKDVVKKSSKAKK